MRPHGFAGLYVGLGFASGSALPSCERFWAVAARMNSSRAPLGPRKRRRSSLRMRLRCADSISLRSSDVQLPSPLSDFVDRYDAADRRLFKPILIPNSAPATKAPNGARLHPRSKHDDYRFRADGFIPEKSLAKEVTKLSRFDSSSVRRFSTNWRSSSVRLVCNRFRYR
jgi:hypothetical protein